MLQEMSNTQSEGNNSDWNYGVRFGQVILDIPRRFGNSQHSVDVVW